MTSTDATILLIGAYALLALGLFMTLASIYRLRLARKGRTDVDITRLTLDALKDLMLGPPILVLGVMLLALLHLPPTQTTLVVILLLGAGAIISLLVIIYKTAQASKRHGVAHLYEYRLWRFIAGE